jgi:carbonic anhydrase/acetyltransferase-like protein (isoleucine patch superfamily)
MPRENDAQRQIQHGIERLERTLARTRAPGALAGRSRDDALAEGKSSGAAARPFGFGLVTLATLLLVAALFAETRGLFLPGLIMGAVGVLALFARRGEKLLSTAAHASGGAPQIGMGATIASNAVLGAGAIVEMGATVGDSARLEQGAVVRMGASIGRDAVLEEGATVSWGASIGAGAVIGAGAHVAAGSDVEAGARVPAGTSLMPGTSWTRGMSGGSAVSLQASIAAMDAPADPRAAHIARACDRLEDEFARAPEPVRRMFGDSRLAISGLRRTCLDLLAREQALRAEAAPEALQRLDQEKAALEARLAGASDEHVQRSLTGAVAAISGQREQRRLFQRSADRLEAELTRLIWTLDGMGTELLRVRTTGAELYEKSGSSALTQSVQQLHEEIDSIAAALEELHEEESAPDAHAVQGPRLAGGGGQGGA